MGNLSTSLYCLAPLPRVLLSSVLNVTAGLRHSSSTGSEPLASGRWGRSLGRPSHTPEGLQRVAGFTSRRALFLVSGAWTEHLFSPLPTTLNLCHDVTQLRALSTWLGASEQARVGTAVPGRCSDSLDMLMKKWWTRPFSSDPSSPLLVTACRASRDPFTQQRAGPEYQELKGQADIPSARGKCRGGGDTRPLQGTVLCRHSHT